MKITVCLLLTISVFLLVWCSQPISKLEAEKCIYNNEKNREDTIDCIDRCDYLWDGTCQIACSEIAMKSELYNKECDETDIFCNRLWYTGKEKIDCVERYLNEK